MAENYLITGYWGVPHVTAENDRGINAAIFGAGRFVLPVGEQFRAEYIGNNTVRIYDGKLIDNGAAAGIPAGEYVDLVIPEAGQGMKRNDLIIFQYSQDTSTLIESGVFTVLSGEETSGTAIDPALSQQDILTNEATLDQMALWRVSVSGTVISAPVQLFEVSKNMRNAAICVVEATSSDGVAYSATVPGVTELFAGLEITIIPQLESTSETITLDVNGLGAKNVRLPLSSNTTTLVMPEQPNYYTAGRPVKLRYDATWLNRGAWVVAERQRTSGNDLYGNVPIEKGGTGADNAEEARTNLGAAPSGYGLGEYIGAFPVLTTSEVNSALKTGWYRVSSGGTGTPLTGILHVESFDDNHCKQTLYGATTGASVCRVKIGGTWGEWEAINPSMSVNTETRTTERYNGKTVFAKLVDFGAMPNATSKTVAYRGTGSTGVVSLTAMLSDGCCVSGGVCMDRSFSNVDTFSLDSTKYNVRITTASNWSSLSAYVLVKYTLD